MDVQKVWDLTKDLIYKQDERKDAHRRRQALIALDHLDVTANEIEALGKKAWQLTQQIKAIKAQIEELSDNK